MTIGTLIGKGLSHLNALTLLRKLFWEVTSAIQEEYSQATEGRHFFKTGLHKQSLKFVVEKDVHTSELLEIFL